MKKLTKKQLKQILKEFDSPIFKKMVKESFDDLIMFGECKIKIKKP